MSKYIHQDFTHNQDSPAEIVAVLQKAFNPASVVDVGCGTGNFLFHFKKAGVKEVLGFDGAWADKKVLAKHLAENEFREVDLEQPLKIDRKFDLALCAEVAEHIGEKYADNLVASLVGLSDLIVFSAAIPYQGGQNHINEQWMSYWTEKFKQHDYEVFDLLRPVLWNNERVQWWYKQNLYVVARKGKPFDGQWFSAQKQNGINTYIHPDLYIKTSKHLEDLLDGKFSLGFYAKLIKKKLFKK